MKRLHIVPEFNEANGVFVVARMLAGEDGGRVVDAHDVSRADIDAVDEVWVHGMWLPCEWRACRMALRAGKRLVRMTHGSLSPIYLERQGKWKKRLVAPVERRYFAKCDRVVLTGAWEEEWCRKWGVKGPFETVDLKKFFDFGRVEHVERVESGALHLLYLGRRHPLKGLEWLEKALRQLQSKGVQFGFRVVSNAFGEEKESIWEWCDVLVLPTLSENFGLVVAEALERGKRVITTDGAPAWGDGNDYGGRLIYLKGFLNGSDETRARLLKEAIGKVVPSRRTEGVVDKMTGD